MLTGHNEILTQAQNTKEETEIASEKEAIQLTIINKESTDNSKYDIGEELRDRTLSNGDKDIKFRAPRTVVKNGPVFARTQISAHPLLPGKLTLIGTAL